MLKFALKNMLVRKSRMALVALSIIISACVGLLAYNVSGQISDGIITTAAKYDIILGPSGSSTQLAMNTMFFTDKPLGTIPYDYVTELQKSGMTNAVVPFTMGDSFNSARIVGTIPSFLDGKKVDEGELFTVNGVYDAVVGSQVAKDYHLNIGDKMITSHGLAETGTEHASSPLTVVGILEKTGTAYDNAVFTSYKTVWAVHGSEEHEHEHEEEEEEEAEATEGMVCAILVKSKGFNEYSRLTAMYGENSKLLIINPNTVLREVLNNVDTSTKIVYVLCAVILIMNMLVISVVTLLNLFDAKKEISLMRMIGISMKKIGVMYFIQNGILGLVSTLLSLLLAHLSLGLMNTITAPMGIVLSQSRVYPLEIAICALVWIISVLPTMLCILRMSKKDVLVK